MTASPNRGRPRDPHLSGRILDAALTEYARTGWSAFTIDGVAREAAVGKAALYRRWASKEDLLLEALEVRSSVVPTVEITGDLNADLATLSASLLAHFLDPAGWATLRAAVDAASDDPPLTTFHSRIVRTHREMASVLFDHYVEAGALTARFGTQLLGEQLFGAVLMHVLTLLPEERPLVRADPITHVRPITDLFLAGAAQPTRAQSVRKVH